MTTIPPGVPSVAHVAPEVTPNGILNSILTWAGTVVTSMTDLSPDEIGKVGGETVKQGAEMAATVMNIFAPGLAAAKQGVMTSDIGKGLVTAVGDAVDNAVGNAVDNAGGTNPTDLIEVLPAILNDVTIAGKGAITGVVKGYIDAYSAEKYSQASLVDLLNQFTSVLNEVTDTPDEIPGRIVDAGGLMVAKAVKNDKEGILPLLVGIIFITCLFLVYMSSSSLNIATSPLTVKTATLSTTNWTGKLNFAMPYKLYTPLAAIRTPFTSLQKAANSSASRRDDAIHLRESTDEERRILNRIVDPSSKTALGFSMAPSFLQSAMLRTIVVVSACLTLFLLMPKLGKRRTFMGPLTFISCALLITFYVGMFTD